MGTQACCLCGQRTSMSGASDSAECNSAGRTDSKSVFLANPRFVCSPSPTRLTMNKRYPPVPELSLVEYAGSQIDLAALQFLRSTVGSFSIYPNGDPFDVFLALHQRGNLSYAPGCPFAPDAVIARPSKNERPVAVQGEYHGCIRIASAVSRVTLSAKSFLRLIIRRSSGVEFTSVCWRVWFTL